MKSAGTPKKALALGWMVVVLVVLSWSGGRPSDQEQSDMTEAEKASGKVVENKPQDLPEMMVRLTPNGWEKAEGVLQFTPENLYEQIDGRAEFYLSYDVVSMSFASFVNRADSEQFIELSIYDMGTPVNAFGVFSAERSQGETSLDLGRASYRSGSHYFIWKGRYYIRIISSSSDEGLRKVGMHLAREVTHSLPDSGEPVWGLTALPQLGLDPGSVRYFKVDALGLDFMGNTYTARYRKGAHWVTVFISKRESPERAEAALGRYAEYATRYGKDVERMTLDRVELLACDMKGSYDVVFRKGRLVGGVYSAEDRNLAVEAATELWRQLGHE